MLVSLNNAGIRRSNRWMVRGISMTVEPGEIVTLIGPNGSGKSTTAKMALGVLNPDEGMASQKSNLPSSPSAPRLLPVCCLLKSSYQFVCRLSVFLYCALLGSLAAYTCNRANLNLVTVLN